MLTIGFRHTGNLARGAFVAVTADSMPAGRIEQNNLGVWCYFQKASNVFAPELTDSDLAMLKQAIAERLHGKIGSIRGERRSLGL